MNKIKVRDMLNIHTNTLQSIFDRAKQKSSSQDVSYREVLDEIRKVNERLYDQLDLNINYLFTIDECGLIEKITLLHFAAEKNYLQIVELFFDNDADIEVKTSEGNYTPLHLAAKRGHLEVIEFLLDKKANMEASSANSKTALHYAVEGGNLESIKLLLDKGASIKTVDILENTLLHTAAIKGHLEVVQELLSRKLSVDAKNTHTYTPLHLAAKEGYLKVTELLLNSGADIKAQGFNSKTALHYVAEKGDYEIAKLLLSRGADTEITDNIGNTPLHLAVREGHLDIVQELLSRGAHIDVTNEDNYTPYQIAIKSKYQKIAEVLLQKKSLLENSKDEMEENQLAAEDGHSEEISNNTSSNNSHARSNEQATDIYQKLSTIEFNGNDSGNYQKQAGTNQINSYVNQAVNNDGNKLAYYIGPTKFGFDSEEGIKNVAKHICKRIDKEGNVLNDFYDTENPLDKPFIVISNTDTVLAQNPTNVNSQSGDHWTSWVLLPKKYTSLSGKEVNNDKYQVLFFDSLGQASFPEKLKTYLTECDEITDTGERLMPFCKEEEIEFKNLNDLTKHYINGNDCSWWVTYYALMTVYSGEVKFLEPLKGRILSAMPLRNIMKLEENTLLDQAERQHNDNNYNSEEALSENNEDEMEENNISLSDISSISENLDDSNSELNDTNDRDSMHAQNQQDSNLKVGAALGKGDCFFDAVAEGLNELKNRDLIVSDKRFSTSSLREDCANYAKQHEDKWIYKVIEGAEEGGYSVAQGSLYNNIQDPRIQKMIFNKYLENIKNIGTGDSSVSIRGRVDIEGKMICEKYQVTIEAMTPAEPLNAQHVIEVIITKQGENIIYTVENDKRHLMPQSLHPLDEAELNRNEISEWEKPKISSITEFGTPTRFDGQIILQLENDPVVMEAAAKLAAKHPESSVIVQLDTQSNYQVVHGNFDILEGKENLRWQVVGHGRTDKTLGGYSATELADKIADFTIELDTEYNISSSPKYISLVGCSLIDNVEMNYARELALSLDEQGISADIAARSARVAVNNAGEKLTEDSAGNWNYKISEDKVVYAWNEEGKLVPQIGQRAVQLLRSMDLAENFHQAMSEIYKSNQLPEGKWWPMLRNAAKDTQADDYQVQFVNVEQQLQTVTTHDRRIVDFIEDYNKKLAETKAAFDVESVDGLNSAFIVKTLVPWFANKSRMATADDDTPEILKTALQAHTWVNLAQMGHGAVEDIAKITKLYQVAIAISEGKEVVNEMLSPLESVAKAGPGVLLNIGSIVLDSIELAHAQNEAQKAIYGTQLAFDTAGLVTSVAGIGASIAGATTIAAFAGAGGVILGGLGIGITALAESFSAIARNAQAVGSYFADLDAAYSQGGYRHSTKTMKDGTAYDVMEPIPGAVITTLDLPNKQLTFDSQYIYSNHYAGFGDPAITLDKAQAINIRKGIGYPAAEVSFDYDNATLILPTTTKSYLSYAYDPFFRVIHRHYRGFDIARRLEEEGRFDFDFPTLLVDKVICKLIPEYIGMSIKVILDEQNRDILISQLPRYAKGKLSYQLCGNGGEYRISLQDGVSLSLQSGSSSTNWILDARQIDSAETSIDKNLLKVGNVEITLPDESCGNISVIDNNNDMFAIDRENKEKTLLEVNDKQFTDWQALHEHLKLYSHPDNHNSFVKVDNYQSVTGGGNVGRAFYEVSADRFIYTNKPEWSEFLSSAELAKVEGNKAWFYREAEIWQVEIATGKVLRQYLPFNTVDMEFISSSVLQHDNQLYMVIKQKLDDNNFTYTYNIEDEALKLVAIDGDTALIARLENSNEEELSSILIMPTIDYDQWLTEKNLTFSDHQVKATPANVVKISDNKWLYFDENGIKDFVKVNAEPEDLALVFVNEQAGYFFYSNKEHSIYFQKDNGLSGTEATKIDVNSVKSIFSHNEKHFALTYEGTLWSLDDQGTAKLAGVTGDWLSHHRENLIKDLGQLANDTANKLSNLLLLGMQDSNGNSVNAWYDSIAGLVIQGGPNLNAEHNLTYLGLTNDNKQAWIFDADDQAIYRQPLADIVLNEKLVLTVPGDSAELFHLEQKYVNVVRDGTNLRMETSDGAVLLLPVDSDLAQKPTLIAFHVKAEQILSALQALIDDYELPPAIRLLVESDREPAWYLTEEKKILHGNGLEDGHFLHYLGKAAGLESWYIHDQNTGQLWSVSSDQSVVVGNYSFVHLEQDNLILQVSEVIPHSLPQLQGVSNLIISSKVSGDYLLDSSLLTHYQQIVIDGQGTINLENDSTFSLQRSGKNIILHYDSLNTDILISNIDQAVQQGMILKICDTQLPLNQLLTELGSNNNYLELTVGKGQLLVDADGDFFDEGDSYPSDSGLDLDRSMTTHDYSNFSMLNS